MELFRKRCIDKKELRHLLVLMVPLFMANIMQLGMGFVDTFVAGAAGEKHLAAVALGCSVTTPIMVAFGAVLSICGPMVSMLRGAGCGSRVGLLLNSAKNWPIYLCWVSCSPCMERVIFMIA